MSSTYQKYAAILCFISMGYICLCSMLSTYASDIIADVGAAMVSPSVRAGNSFVPLLLPVCVLLPSGCCR
jgi:hypothetical protein